MMDRLILAIIMIILGLLSIISALCNSDWFFKTQSCAFFIRNIGRGLTRLLYLSVGIAALYMAYTLIEEYLNL